MASFPRHVLSVPEGYAKGCGWEAGMAHPFRGEGRALAGTGLLPQGCRALIEKLPHFLNFSLSALRASKNPETFCPMGGLDWKAGLRGPAQARVLMSSVPPSSHSSIHHCSCYWKLCYVPGALSKTRHHACGRPVGSSCSWMHQS